MPELAVYNGRNCIGYIKETEGGCDAFAASNGRDVRLGRFANRQDAKAAISQAGQPSEKGSGEEPFSPSKTGAVAGPVSAAAAKPVPARNRLSANAAPVQHLTTARGKRGGR